MKKEIVLEIDEDLIKEAEVVLDNSYLNIQTCVKILLARIAKEKSASFLTMGQTSEPSNKTVTKYAKNSNVRENNQIIKSQAIKLCSNHGVKLANNVTFASLSSTGDFYWANPQFDFLNEDWTLILNDSASKKLHVFFIPARSIAKMQLIPRSDMPHLISLYINYGDRYFRDRTTELSFAKFLVAEIEY